MEYRSYMVKESRKLYLFVIKNLGLKSTTQVLINFIWESTEYLPYNAEEEGIYVVLIQKHTLINNEIKSMTNN